MLSCFDLQEYRKHLGCRISKWFCPIDQTTCQSCRSKSYRRLLGFRISFPRSPDSTSSPRLGSIRGKRSKNILEGSVEHKHALLLIVFYTFTYRPESVAYTCIKNKDLAYLAFHMPSLVQKPLSSIHSIHFLTGSYCFKSPIPHSHMKCPSKPPPKPSSPTSSAP